jgi:hypothetical protein
MAPASIVTQMLVMPFELRTSRTSHVGQYPGGVGDRGIRGDLRSANLQIQMERRWSDPLLQNKKVS